MTQALNIPLDEFLRPFFDAGETVCLRVFDDKKGGVFKGAKLECAAGQINAMIGTLRDHNARDRGVFFVVNFGGHEDSDIRRINAQFVECDRLPIAEQLAQIRSFPVEPSLIVKTRKSLHVYWLMKAADVAAFRRVQRRLIAQFNGDPACVNESRVMRLPGFEHRKGDPVMVECVKFNPELRYTQAELEAALPEVGEDPARSVPPAKGTRNGLALVLRRCEFMKHCVNDAQALSEHDWYSMITNLAVFEGGDKAIHGMSAAYPKYNARETNQKVHHFLESGTKPITCGTISEKGYQCPRLAEGGCGVKSPVALCYKPTEIGDLRSFLSEQEVKKSAVDDIHTVKDFISEYMYNIEPVLAEAFITYEMRKHFSLKAGDMKPLVSFHKEIYKRYSESKEVQGEASGDELPQWYEPTDHGGLRFLSGLLANHMAGHVDAFYVAGGFYFYHDGVYAMGEDLLAAARAREFMIPRYANMTAINDAVGQWRMLIGKAVREINCNPFIINVKNGMYNVLDDTFKAHTPRYYSTVRINAAYTQEARCPRFLGFLGSILGDEEIHLMQEIFGYLLIPVNKAQKSFVFVGAPNTGKSTLLSVAQEILLGSENVSNIPWQGLGDRFNKAELFGKLANIFADLPSKNVDDNGIFKALTGEDYITAERKNKDPFSFRPYARLLFSCNEIPRNYGDRSDGFYRRLVIIRFNRSIPAGKRDPDLRERLAVEGDGIFMWALQGLKRLIRNSYVFSETEATQTELQRYRIENNSVLLFISECCTIEKDAECAREELFQAYREYCAKNGLKAMSQTNFNKDVESVDPLIEKKTDKLGKRRIWRGLRYHGQA